MLEEGRVFQAFILLSLWTAFTRAPHFLEKLISLA
jgi:hypothetical protein